VLFTITDASELLMKDITKAMICFMPWAHRSNEIRLHPASVWRRNSTKSGSHH